MKIEKQDDFYSDIIKLIESAKNKVYQTINATMTQTYWKIGERIVEREQHGEGRASYGKSILKNLSKELTAEFGKGFSVDNLENMRKFYLAYSKSETLSRNFNLSWSHYIFLTRLNEKERSFYELEAIENNWSLRELKRQFNSGLYERLQLSKDKHQIEQLSKKGQMMMYVNYFDRYEKQDTEHKTVGIILCKDKSNTFVKMILPEDNSQIYASKYLTVLPNKEELKHLLEDNTIE